MSFYVPILKFCCIMLNFYQVILFNYMIEFQYEYINFKSDEEKSPDLIDDKQIDHYSRIVLRISIDSIYTNDHLNPSLSTIHSSVIWLFG